MLLLGKNAIFSTKNPRECRGWFHVQLSWESAISSVCLSWPGGFAGLVTLNAIVSKLI